MLPLYHYANTGLLQVKGGLSNVMGFHQLESKVFTNKMIQHREKLFRYYYKFVSNLLVFKVITFISSF